LAGFVKHPQQSKPIHRYNLPIGYIALVEESGQSG